MIDEESPLAPASPGQRRVFWIVVPVALVLVVFIGILATADTESTTARSALLGRVAPDIVGEDLQGSAFTLADHRGKWVLVNFFSTTCAPCIEEHPELIEFSERHAVGDAMIVSLAFSDRAANVREFFASFGGDWPVLASDTGRYAISYGVPQVPETFLVNPSGIVVEKYEGGVTADFLDAEIRRLSIS